MTQLAKKTLVGTIGLLLICLTWSCSTINPAASLSNPAMSGQTDLAEQQAAAPMDDLLVDEQTPPEPEATMAMEMKELEALGDWESGTPEASEPQEETVYDFPITMNRQVEFYLDFFTQKNRRGFAKWLARSGRYLPMIKKELKEAGLPLDLAYLPMIESGFSLTAYSRARAVGPWQFMRATGSKFGLTVDDYVDERRDPEKSTRAAISYLKYLHERFQSWHLAVAAYNAGEGKIARAIRKHKTHDFWTLAQKRYLKLETKRYVPKLIAAIIIAKNPAEYGFTDIEYHEPLAYDTLQVNRWTSLRAVAVACGRPFEEIWDLNRQLRKAISPPSSSAYIIKVPASEGEMTAQNLPRVRATVITDYKTHRVRQGETLARICRKYNLNTTTLLKANNLRTPTLSTEQRLRIPYQTTSYVLMAETTSQPWGGPADKASMENLVLHKIRPGETLSVISKRYGVPMLLIAAWNDLKDLARIRAGQQLALYLKDNPGSTASLGMDNTMTMLTKAQGTIATTKALGGKHTYYRVQGGDSLWKIARRFKTTPEEIRRLNNLKGNLIHPGRQLVLKTSADADA